jgi:hypothetical protein
VKLAIGAREGEAALIPVKGAQKGEVKLDDLGEGLGKKT